MALVALPALASVAGATSLAGRRLREELVARRGEVAAVWTVVELVARARLLPDAPR